MPAATDLSKFLDIDYLKSFGQSHNLRPQWFGLGFIQLKLDATRRLHFWDPSLAELVNEEELHDHRYDFKSTILAGSIDHIVYAFEASETGEFEMCEVFCQPEKSAEPRVLKTGDVKKVAHHTFKTGDSYTFKVGEFHKGVSAKAVTYLERGKIMCETARIIRPKTEAQNWLCPFTSKLTEEQAWAEIARIIADLQTAKAA